MNPARLLTLTGTLTHVAVDEDAERDDYNNPIPTTTTSTVECWIEQASASESTVDTAFQAEDYRIYLEAGTVVSGADRLTVLGVTYEIVGPPWPAVSPRTRQVTHIEAKGRCTT